MAALWHAEKLGTGKERHKDNQALSKVVRCGGRKSEAGILDRNVEGKNRVDVERLPEIPKLLGTQRN